MHQKCVWRSGSARTRWGSLQRSPPPSWIQGVLLLGEGRGGKRKEKEGKGQGEGREGRGRGGEERGGEFAQFCIQIWGIEAPVTVYKLYNKLSIFAATGTIRGPEKMVYTCKFEIDLITDYV